jgi:hypothetical protein
VAGIGSLNGRVEARAWKCTSRVASQRSSMAAHRIGRDSPIPAAFDLRDIVRIGPAMPTDKPEQFDEVCRVTDALTRRPSAPQRHAGMLSRCFHRTHESPNL